MPAITADPAKELTAYFRIGRDGALSFVYYDSNDDAFSLSGYTFVLNFKVRKDDSTNFLQLTSGSGLTITSNMIAVSITAAQAARFREQTYYWELVRTYSGLTKNWLSGDAVFHFGKFDGVQKKNSTSSSDDSEVTILIEDNDQIVYITIEEFSPPVGAVIYQGLWNPSGGTLPGTGQKGWFYRASADGTVGGFFIPLGAWIFFLTDDPGQTPSNYDIR